jgi:hypothetical protein
MQSQVLDCEELSQSFKEQFGDQVFALRQELAMDFKGDFLRYL